MFGMISELALNSHTRVDCRQAHVYMSVCPVVMDDPPKSPSPSLNFKDLLQLTRLALCSVSGGRDQADSLPRPRRRDGRGEAITRIA